MTSLVYVFIRFISFFIVFLLAYKTTINHQFHYLWTSILLTSEIEFSRKSSNNYILYPLTFIFPSFRCHGLCLPSYTTMAFYCRFWECSETLNMRYSSGDLFHVFH